MPGCLNVINAVHSDSHGRIPVLVSLSENLVTDVKTDTIYMRSLIGLPIDVKYKLVIGILCASSLWYG